VSTSFTYHNDDNFSTTTIEKTNVLCDSDRVVNITLQFVSNTKSKIDACVDHTRPSPTVEIKEIKKAFHDAKKRGVKIRYITEITTENVSFCKELATIVDELRHLDGIKGNFYRSEREYIAPVALHEKGKPSSQIIYSNMKEIVEEQQYIFDILWNKSESADDKIKEIEQGIEPEYFRVIHDNEEATHILIDLAKHAQNEILLLLPNDKVLDRIDKLGIVDYLINNYNQEKKEDVIQVKIICPISDANLYIVNRILQNTTASNNIRIVNGSDSSSVMIIVDNTKFLKAELREPEAEEFSKAIGLSFYSNSMPSVESYKLFFELLWNERTSNEQFKLSDKMQREFINIAAHELRTPAQSVLGYAELVREDMMVKQADIESLEAIEAIYRNAERLQRLTNDILDISRIEGQTLTLNKEIFDLNDLILIIVEDYKGHIRKNNRNISNKKNTVQLLCSSSQGSNSALIVEADRDRISQVVSNLLNNAIKFTSQQGGTISVYMKKRNGKKNGNQGEVVLTIVDTGEGIHPEIVPRLFTKFASRSNSGTGLGLYISKGIVEAHGGKIWAENNDDRKGATFSFSLPITQINNEE
jgi:two-component system sensor histidine kinase VicK